MKMKWMIGIGLAACLGQLVWGQPVEDLSSFSREQLQQLQQQLKEQEKQLMSFWIDEEWQADEEIKKHQERSLLQTNLPQPSLANDMMLVRIVGIRRVDEEVLRYYPASPNWLPYYELHAQVLKSWIDQYVVGMPKIKLPVRAGDILHLLWMGCKREKGGELVPAPSVWEVGKQYLITGYPVFIKAPWDEHRPRWMIVQDNPSWDRVWLRAGLGECSSGFIGRGWSSVNHITSFAVPSPAALVLQVPNRIEAPFEEQVLVLDEEVAYYRLATREQRIQWAKQRVQNSALPLWKRQRALLYLYIVYDPHYYPSVGRFPPDEVLRQQYPGEEPYVVRGRLRSRRVVEYLTYLQGLSEPLLQAFGLRVVDRHGGLYSKAPAEEVERWVKIVESFLEAGRPVAVRREAAELLANKLERLFFAETDSYYYVKATESDWTWLRVYAQVLRGRWEREQDKVVRAHLAKGWTSLLSKEVRRQLEAIEKRLRELGQGE
jgi:hypothetical protein